MPYRPVVEDMQKTPTAVQLGRGAAGIETQQAQPADIRGPSDSELALSAMGSLMNTGADVAVKVKARDDEKAAVQGYVDQVMGQDLDEQKSLAYKNAFYRSEKAATVKSFVNEQIAFFNSESGRVMDAKQASAHMNDGYTKLRAQFEKAGDFMSTDAFDSYMVKSMPVVTDSHAKSHAGYLKEQGVKTVNSQIEVDVEAMKNGTMTVPDLVGKYTAMGKAGVFNLTAPEVEGILAEQAQERIRLGDPSLMKALQAVEDEDGYSIYDHGPHSKALQGAMATYQKKIDGELTKEKVMALDGLNTYAESGTLDADYLWDANTKGKLGLSMEKQSELLAKSRKNAAKKDYSATIHKALMTGTAYKLGDVKDKELQDGLDSIMNEIDTAAGDNQNPQQQLATFNQKLRILADNGMVSNKMKSRFSALFTTLPDKADMQVSKDFEAGVAMYQMAKQIGYTNITDQFGGEKIQARLEGIANGLDTGLSIHAAAYQQGKAEQIDLTPADLRRMMPDKDVDSFYTEAVTKSPWYSVAGMFDSDPDYNAAEKARLIRTANQLLRTGQAHDGKVAMQVAWDSLEAGREVVNGRFVYKPKGTRSIAERMGVPTANPDAVVKEFWNEYQAELAPKLFPDVDAEEFDYDNVVMELDPSGQAAVFMYKDESGMQLPASYAIPLSMLGAQEKVRRDAAVQEKLSDQRDDNAENYNMHVNWAKWELASSPIEFVKKNPAFNGLDAEKWAAMSPRGKALIIKEWQATSSNASTQKLNAFRQFFGIEPLPLADETSVRRQVLGVDGQPPLIEEQSVLDELQELFGPTEAGAAMQPAGETMPRGAQASMQNQHKANVDGFRRNEVSVVSLLGLNKGIIPLLEVTRIAETQNGKAGRKQGDSGPALGLYQMEPATASDLLTNYLTRKPAYLKKVLSLAGAENEYTTIMAGGAPSKELLAAYETNDKYAAAMAAMHYQRYLNGVYPTTAEGLINTHIKEYNRGGKASVDHTKRLLQAEGFSLF